MNRDLIFYFLITVIEINPHNKDETTAQDTSTTVTKFISEFDATTK